MQHRITAYMSLILNILSEEIVFMVMFFTLLLMGVGLSMDAFAVSICKGLSMRKVNKKQCLVLAYSSEDSRH